MLFITQFQRHWWYCFISSNSNRSRKTTNAPTPNIYAPPKKKNWISATPKTHLANVGWAGVHCPVPTLAQPGHCVSRTHKYRKYIYKRTKTPILTRTASIRKPSRADVLPFSRNYRHSPGKCENSMLIILQTQFESNMLLHVLPVPIRLLSEGGRGHA